MAEADYTLLMLSEGGDCRSQIARGWAEGLAEGRIRIVNAGLEERDLDPLAVQVMQEVGIDIFGQHSKRLGDLGLNELDAVVCVGGELPEEVPQLPGGPVVLRWEIAHPRSLEEGSLEAYRRVRDQIQRQVQMFLQGDYLAALAHMKREQERALDHLPMGVMVHCTRRRITLFNRQAEKMTGYDRGEVIGRDCHDVFKGHFCCSRCAFEDGAPELDQAHYPITFTARDGAPRRLEMSVVALRDQVGRMQGVMGCFRDVTEVTQLRQQLQQEDHFHNIVGTDGEMQKLFGLIRDLGSSDCPVLIQGESGTGKELVANAIHRESPRMGKPFVTVNCGALPEGILESELFGHVRGAFTGAVRDKKGRFELADGGTLFLDEVAELSPTMQVKLLRALQEGSFERVGGEKTIKVDVRVLSATNKDLKQMVRKKAFREDLFYRLCVVPLTLPPLRRRRGDIPSLVEHFVEHLNEVQGRSIRGIHPEALDALMDYDWPGNIRELQNALQYAFVKCKEEVIQSGHLPPEIVTALEHRPRLKPGRRTKLEGKQVEAVLAQSKGNKVEAARRLGVGRATLYRFLKKHEMV